MRFLYPLTGPQIALFRDFFRRKYGQPLFYVSEQLIQSTFLEFQDSTDDPESLHNYVLDVVAAAEDAHEASRRLQKIVEQHHKAERPCPKCGQTGVIMPYMNPCPRCDGRGRISKRTLL